MVVMVVFGVVVVSTVVVMFMVPTLYAEEEDEENDHDHDVNYVAAESDADDSPSIQHRSSPLPSSVSDSN